MNNDPASLDNLRPLVEPPPPPWWPPAPGWWAVFFVAMVFAILAAVRAWIRWRANAYRRAALKELQAASSVSEIAEILKRTALCAYPRTQVASLFGRPWCRWLAETSGLEVPSLVAQALVSDVFRESDDSDTAQLAEFTANWIKHHDSAASSQRACKTTEDASC